MAVVPDEFCGEELEAVDEVDVAECVQVDVEHEGIFGADTFWCGVYAGVKVLNGSFDNSRLVIVEHDNTFGGCLWIINCQLRPMVLIVMVLP